MSRYSVEVFAGPVEAAALGEVGSRLRAVAEALRSEGFDIRYLSSILMPADELCFHLFEAPSIEAVDAVSVRAGLRAIRVTRVVTGPDVGAAATPWDRGGGRGGDAQAR